MARALVPNLDSQPFAVIATEIAAMLVMTHLGDPWAGETTHMGFRGAGALMTDSP